MLTADLTAELQQSDILGNNLGWKPFLILFLTV